MGIERFDFEISEDDGKTVRGREYPMRRRVSGRGDLDSGRRQLQCCRRSLKRGASRNWLYYLCTNAAQWQKAVGQASDIESGVQIGCGVVGNRNERVEGARIPMEVGWKYVVGNHER